MLPNPCSGLLLLRAHAHMLLFPHPTPWRSLGALPQSDFYKGKLGFIVVLSSCWAALRRPEARRWLLGCVMSGAQRHVQRPAAESLAPP